MTRALGCGDRISESPLAQAVVNMCKSIRQLETFSLVPAPRTLLQAARDNYDLAFDQLNKLSNNKTKSIMNAIYKVHQSNRGMYT